MRTTGIMCRRRGVSTILGTMIFIGILFTAVIPMMLVMKQADTIYEQRKLEAARFDEDRAREDIDVYVYPTGGGADDNLTVQVESRCEMSVEVVRVWINDAIHPLFKVVSSMNELELGSFDVAPSAGSSFEFRVTTARGNTFEAETGVITHDGFGWVVENKMINVLVSAPGVVFKIYVTGPNDYNEYAMVWKIGGSAFKSFDITLNGNGVYNVVVKRGSRTLLDEDVEMEWPSGPSVLWVYAD